MLKTCPTHVITNDLAYNIYFHGVRDVYKKDNLFCAVLNDDSETFKFQ